MSGNWTCELCGDHNQDPLEHLRLVHPDYAEPVTVWPDGAVVVIDTTIEPEEFHG